MRLQRLAGLFLAPLQGSMQKLAPSYLPGGCKQWAKRIFFPEINSVRNPLRNNRRLSPSEKQELERAFDFNLADPGKKEE